MDGRRRRPPGLARARAASLRKVTGSPPGARGYRRSGYSRDDASRHQKKPPQLVKWGGEVMGAAVDARGRRRSSLQRCHCQRRRLPSPLTARHSHTMPSRVVTYTHRPNSRRGKKAQPAALSGTVVVTERRCTKCGGSFAAMRDDAPPIAHQHADKRLTASVGIIQRQHHDRRHRPAHRQDDPTGRPRHNRQGRTRTALAQLRRRSAARRPGSTRAFPSWFMRITCDRCGKDLMQNHG
jgi:ribosomal protein S27AE